MTSRNGELGDDGRSGRMSGEFSDDIPSSSNGESSQINIDSSAEETDVKRANAKKLIERYFYQLRDGCGNEKCQNVNCASSGKVKVMTANEAAGMALQLFRQEAPLCEIHPSKVRRTTEPGVTIFDTENSPISSSVEEKTTQCFSPPKKQEPFTLTERRVHEIVRSCTREGCYSFLIRTIGEVYSNYESLGKSFLTFECYVLRGMVPRMRMKKEKVRELEGEQEKDVDSSAVPEEKKDPLDIDMPSLHRAYSNLFRLEESIYADAMVNALFSLADTIELELRIKQKKTKDIELMVNAAYTAFEIPSLQCDDYMSAALPRLCRAVTYFPIYAQGRLAHLWAHHSHIRLRTLLHTLHQIVTLKVIGGSFTREYSVQDEDTIICCTKIMKIIYYASILAGELDSPELREDLSCDFELPPMRISPPIEDPLAKELKINVLDCRRPLIPFCDFYNDPLSDVVEMDKDFANYKASESNLLMGPFSFMKYAFILTPATKILGLYYDNRIRMYSERRISFLQTVVGQPTQPYLKLKVHRDKIVDDALVELEMVAMENPKDFKKQLVVEFEGEQGIDEGGVSKEFFQLIVEEIFNPDYGMFVLHEESQTYWFNTTSFESEAQFTLIGVVIGLAIYNNIILDVHFPMVVYRKLMGKKGTFHDLKDWNESLYNGLLGLLEYKDDNLEETFMQTFRISYTDVFESVVYYDLVPDGDSIVVTKENRQEFVDLYADFLVNGSVEKQFKAFRKGFTMVTDESPLHLLFRPEEVEQLVCGSKTFNMKELEEATEYDGGYTNDTPVIIHFWEIVHSLTLEFQRKLLQFATGSDRVPVGGFKKLKLIIARNGPDCNRLPTAHTCYNVLLLPEYETKEKLQDRLMKAINYSKGFGML